MVFEGVRTGVEFASWSHLSLNWETMHLKFIQIYPVELLVLITLGIIIIIGLKTELGAPSIFETHCFHELVALGVCRGTNQQFV